jgi:hypothetical protein
VQYWVQRELKILAINTFIGELKSLETRINTDVLRLLQGINIRTPKPLVVGSIPTAPAKRKYRPRLASGSFLFLFS